MRYFWLDPFWNKRSILFNLCLESHFVICFVKFKKTLQPLQAFSNNNYWAFSMEFKILEQLSEHIRFIF